MVIRQPIHPRVLACKHAVDSLDLLMPDETATQTVKQPLSKADAIKAYNAAATNEEKAAVYEANPILKSVFSAGNHHVTKS